MKMHRRDVGMAAFVLFFLVAGCTRRQPSASQGSSPRPQRADSAKVRHVVSEWTREGLCTSRDGLPADGHVFFRWTTSEGRTEKMHHAVLKGGYGMMIRCDGYSPQRRYPTPHFELFAHDRGVIVRTTDLMELKRGLSQIPPGETLRLFDTCCASQHSGMDPNVSEEIESLCRERRVTYVDSTEGIICVCQ
jgi:hypothetical protein